MALPGVKINVTGSINRTAANKDGVTGFLLYNDNIADLTTFSITNRIVKFTNLSAIEATGITSTSTNFADEWFYISDFFAYGGTELYIGVYDVPIATYDFVELVLMKDFSQGEIKIYTVPTGVKVLTEADVLTYDAVLAGFDSVEQPAMGLYSADIGTLTLATLPDLRNLSAKAPNVSVVIGQDILNYPLTVTTYSLPSTGAITGALSGASVNQNILEVGKYNYALGSNLNEVGLRINDGVTDDILTPMTLIDKLDQDALNDKGYIFFRYLPNLAGSYLSNDNNSIAITETYNSIHIVRTKNKAVREIDAALSPLIGATILLNVDGTIRPASANTYINAASAPLQTMQDAGEISSFIVTVDLTTNVGSTKTVITNVDVIPTESSDNIINNLSFSTGTS